MPSAQFLLSCCVLAVIIALSVTFALYLLGFSEHARIAAPVAASTSVGMFAARSLTRRKAAKRQSESQA